MLRHGILGLLNYGDMTGYEIMEVFRDSLSFFWSVQTSQLYRELQTLKKKSLVEDRLVEQKGRPDKKVFTITESGRRELVRWLREEVVGLEMRSPLLLQVFFRGLLPPLENMLFFETLKQECLVYSEKLGAAMGSGDYGSGQIGLGQEAVYWQMTVDYGQRYMKMMAEWCDECIRRLGGT